MHEIAFIPAPIAMALAGFGAGAPFFGGFQAIAQQAAQIAATALWQGAVVAGGLALCLRLAPRTPAEHRFRIWAVAFAVLAGLPLATLVQTLVPGSGSSVVAGISSSIRETAARPWFSLDTRWSLAIAGLWAAGSLLRAGGLALNSIRLRSLWKEAIPVSVDERLEAALESGRHAQVCTTTILQRPSVIGFLRPRILIPDWLFARLTAGELEQIVLHEAEHLRRQDDWTNLAQKACLVLFPLNPALAWIERRLCREREMACDDGVIRITRAPRAYAACLASLAERGLERRAEALSLGAWQRRPELVHRVHSILRRKGTLGPAGAGALLGALGCGLLFGSIELARCPQLVAFVSASDGSKAARAAVGGAAVSAQDGAGRLVETAYFPKRRAGVGDFSSGVRAVNLKAIEGARGRGFWGGAGGMAGGTDSGVDGKTSSYRSGSQASHAVVLKADLSEERFVQVQGQQQVESQEQQWIVVTTVLTNWEPAETSSQKGGLRADYETGASADPERSVDASVDSNARAASQKPANAQPWSQMTITRLILKVYRASSLSTQPAVVPVHGGWLVLQL